MRRLVYVSLLIALMLPVPATAQELSSEQLEVWGTIVAQWEAASAKDPTWTETALHPSFLGWSDQNPMPRNKASTKTWQKYSSQNSQVQAEELFPVGIVVVDSTAIAHYYYSTAAEDRDGKRKTTHGRYTDVLVKQDGKWLFIAWRGGDDPRFNK